MSAALDIDKEKLIFEVRCRPVLWRCTEIEYKNQKISSKQWDEVGEACNTTGEELKKKWKNLRDSYCKYLKGDPTTPTSKGRYRYRAWPWAKHMEFLRPFLPVSTKTKSKTSSALSKPDSNLTEDRCDQEQSSQQMGEKYPLLFEKSQSSFFKNTHPLTNECNDTNSQQPKRRRQQIKNKNEDELLSPSPSFVGQLMSYLDRKSNETTSDDIDDLFKGYAKIIKKFPKKRQAIVKFQISKLIMRHELAQLEEEQQYDPLEQLLVDGDEHHELKKDDDLDIDISETNFTRPSLPESCDFER